MNNYIQYIKTLLQDFYYKTTTFIFQLKINCVGIKTQLRYDKCEYDQKVLLEIINMKLL